MTKRRRIVSVTAACLALVVAGGVWLLPNSHPVNRANFERIQVGMTRAEVEVILQCPPGDYTTGPHLTGPWTLASIYRWTRWYSDQGEIAVEFDEEGRVGDRYFSDIEVIRAGFLDRLRGWLGW